MTYRKEQLNRLRRVEGQMRGVLRMIEEEKSCREVVAQLSAIRNAIDRSAAILVADNLKECLQEAQNHPEDSADHLVDEAVQLLVKSR